MESDSSIISQKEEGLLINPANGNDNKVQEKSKTSTNNGIDGNDYAQGEFNKGRKVIVKNIPPVTYEVIINIHKPNILN